MADRLLDVSVQCQRLLAVDDGAVVAGHLRLAPADKVKVPGVQGLVMPGAGDGESTPSMIQRLPVTAGLSAHDGEIVMCRRLPRPVVGIGKQAERPPQVHLSFVKATLLSTWTSKG